MPCINLPTAVTANVARDNNWPLTMLFVLDSKLMAGIIVGVLGCWRPRNIDKVFTRLVSRDHWHTWRYNTPPLETFINGSKYVIILSKVITASVEENSQVHLLTTQNDILRTTIGNSR